MDNLTTNHLVMYVVAREKYLSTLLRDGTISSADFDKMSRFLKEHFHITSGSVDTIRDIEAAITLATPTSARTVQQLEPTEVVAVASEMPAEIQSSQPVFVSLTEAVRSITDNNPGHVIQSWMRNRNTIEFLGIWELAHNPNFNDSGYAALVEHLNAGSFTMTPKQWIDQTNAMGLVFTQGRSGGTYAHPLIACEFMTWLSPAYKFALLEMRADAAQV